MNVVGIIIGVVFLAFCGYLIYRNVRGIIQGVKAKKAAKLENEKDKQEKEIS